MFRYTRIVVALSVMLLLSSSLVTVASAWAPHSGQPRPYAQPYQAPYYNPTYPSYQPTTPYYYPPNYQTNNYYYPPNYQGNNYYYPNNYGANACHPPNYQFYANCGQPPVVVLRPPVYVRPVPVYVKPVPVYVQPAPVYVNQAPPFVDYKNSWGTFGSYDNWARCFYDEHGRPPNSQDVNDFWYSQEYAHYTGRSPYPSTGCGSNNCRY